MFKKYTLSALVAVICVMSIGIASASVGLDAAMIPDLASLTALGDGQMLGMAALAGMGNIEIITKQVETIEKSMSQFIEKANEEIKNSGVASKETKAILDKLGENQREVADRLLAIEQNNQSGGGGAEAIASMGKQFTGSDSYKNFAGGNSQKARFEVQNNTVTGSDVTVAPDRKPGVVGGAFAPMTLETFLPSLPTTSNAIEFTRELLFTNNAAAVAESGAKPETSITFELANQAVSTVAHWVRISKQLASDAPALAAYINLRMAYGVDRKVEMELGIGNGVGANISGLFKASNFTAHGYTAANIGATLPALVLIRKIIADLWTLGYPADAILLNPADWADIEIALLTTTSNAARVTYSESGQPFLWGVPVIQSIGVAADQFQIGSYTQAATVHNRQGTIVELSESDDTNFTSNLVTVRAERRLALTVDRPAAIIGGDLTPL